MIKQKRQQRLKEYCELVYSTVRDLTYIGTEISKDQKHINVIISFIKETITIPISIKEIEANLHSNKGFIELLEMPLKNILKFYNERNKNEKIS